jgi:hypothetical protein
VAETPDPPAEPSEEELRAMLEAREQVHATTQHQLARIGTRVLVAGLAALAIGFFSFSDNREAVASMFREPAPEPARPPQPAPAPAKPADGQVSAADELTRAANDMTSNPLALPSDGKIIHKEDIGFAMELLNFAQGPPTQQAPPAEKAKDQ